MATELTDQTEATGLRERADDAVPLTFVNRHRPRSLRRVTVASEGLIEEYKSRTVVTPWDEVYGVTWKDHHVAVKLASRTVCFGDRFGDWRALGEAIEDRAYWLQPEAAHVEIGPQQIADWLGIEPQETLHCDLGKRRMWGWAIIAIYVLMGVGMAAGDSGGNIGSFAIFLMMGIAILVSADNVRADVHGITLRVKGKPRTFAWSEITSVAGSTNSWTVKTESISFSVAQGMTNVERLVKTLQHVAAARTAGAELPDERPIGEAALSRPGDPVTAEAGLERGLSRTEG